MDINQLSEFIGNHALLVMALGVIVFLLVAGEIRNRLGASPLEPFQATRMVNHEDAMMVDIRDLKDYEAGHIVNALHLPEINDSSLKGLEKHRDQPLIVYCRSGQRSGPFSGQLRGRGFESVYQLKGGLLAWQNANLPLSRK